MTPDILFIGPDSGGGMTAVIRSCCAMFPQARMVGSFRGGSRWHKVLDAAKGMMEMRRLLHKHPEISVVHIHTASNASFRRKMFFARKARKMGRKVVMHVHGGGFREFFATDPAGITQALNSVDHLVVLSDIWADFFKANGVTSPISVIPNPVADPQPVKVESDGKIHFLFLGLLTAEKGLYDLLEAIECNENCRSGKYIFHIGGNGPEQDRLQQLIREKGLENAVILEGWVDGAKKARLLSQADVLLLPSHTEAMPISILEAMSYGKPVIATPVGSVPTVVESGRNGLLVPVGDPKALAEAIDAFGNDAALRRRMGAQSLEMVKPYNLESIAQKLRQLYESL